MFLARGDDGGYWAGVLIHPAPPSGSPRPQLLLVRSDRLDGGGMFFDLKPWLWGGTAVLALSLAFWAPFMLGITRYLRRLTAAADGIAAGDFQLSLPRRGADELGRLGCAIQTMASRLDLLITGQKRFLGDAAHELCAPLARLRAGIAILENKLDAAHAADLDGIEAEAAELAALIEEILAFSRARSRPANPAALPLAALVRQAAAKERVDGLLRADVPEDLTVDADPSLLLRAVCNILRNSLTHAGPQAAITVTAAAGDGRVTVVFTDDGPGVAAEELPRLFEPFYRPDRSRTRETGGFGLGLAIVRAAAESCGGSVAAFLPPAGGLGIRIELPGGQPPAVQTPPC
jgi:two-component system sensor histidine kinase CpxA